MDQSGRQCPAPAGRRAEALATTSSKATEHDIPDLHMDGFLASGKQSLDVGFRIERFEVIEFFSPTPMNLTGNCSFSLMAKMAPPRPCRQAW